MDLDNLNLTVKYRNSLDGSMPNAMIDVIYPADENGSIKILCVPIAEDNTEYKEIMKWVAEGNTIEEAD
jgi:hypothetical protein